MLTKHTHSSTTTHVHVVRNTDSKSLHPDRIITYADHMSQRSLPPTFLPSWLPISTAATHMNLT